MANDNETVEQACESICELVIAIHDKEHNGKQEIKNVWHIVQQVKDRILAAHNREIGELKGGRKGILKANEAFAADNTRLREENATLRALVNELDIALSGSLAIIGNVCEYIQADCGTMLRVEAYHEILAKAREVAK